MELKKIYFDTSLEKISDLLHSIKQDKELSLFQKTLFITDGTVTNLLKLYTGEKINVKKIKHEIVKSGYEESNLFTIGTQILRRNILLSGVEKNYIYVEAIYNFDLHSKAIQKKLIETEQPIGIMWKEEKLEMYREVVDFRREKYEIATQYFDDITADTPILSRTYLVYHKKQILCMITEKFPMTYFKEEK